MSRRNAAIYALVVEISFCAVCIPVGAAVRSGVLKASIYLNVITLLMGMLGLWATVNIRGPWIMSHYAAVFSTSFLFTFYCVVVFAATNSESMLVLLILLVFIVPDIVAAVMTYRLHKSYGVFRADVIAHKYDEFIESATTPSVVAHVAPDMERRPLEPMPRQEDTTATIVQMESIPDTPELYRCPISMEIMRDPVNAEDGYVYERSAIEKWLQQNRKSPMTNLKMSKKLVANNALRSAIMEFVEGYKREREASPDED